MIGFAPRPDAEYVMDVGVSGNKCFVEVVRADAASPTGVALESSLGPRDCFEKGGPKAPAPRAKAEPKT